MRARSRRQDDGPGWGRARSGDRPTASGADRGPDDHLASRAPRSRSARCRPCTRATPASAAGPASTTRPHPAEVVLLAAAEEGRRPARRASPRAPQGQPAGPRRRAEQNVDRRVGGPRSSAGASGARRSRRDASGPPSPASVRACAISSASSPDDRPAVDPVDRRQEGLAAEHVEPGVTPRGRTPEQHHPPGTVGASTRSAWPVFWIGLVGAAVAEDRVGGTPPTAGRRRAAGDRDRVAALGAAFGDEQVPGPSRRKGAAPRVLQARAGPRRLGSVEHRAGRVVDARTRAIRLPRGVVDPAVAVVVPCEVGVDPGDVDGAPGRDHGPAGSSAVTKKLSRLPACSTFVVIIQNRPSWWRSVGAKTPQRRPARRWRARSSCARPVEHVADLGPVDEVRSSGRSGRRGSR